tara:strand:- start:72113 stop:72430 length:318 start_codon:yes stop_codon:yes gene_type:complete
MKILSNQMHCLMCDDRPYSAHRHDYQSCKCGQISVDGGMQYLRRTITEGAQCKEMSIVITDEQYEAIEFEVNTAKETGRNTLGLICAAARSMRDCGLLVQVGDKI